MVPGPNGGPPIVKVITAKEVARPQVRGDETASINPIDASQMTSGDLRTEQLDTCHACNARKSANSRKLPIKTIPVGNAFDRIAIDVMGPLPTTTRGNRFIVVVTEYL